MALEFALAATQYETMATLLDVVPAAISIVIRFKRLSTYDAGDAHFEYVVKKENILFEDRLSINFEANTGKFQLWIEENNNGPVGILSTTTSWVAGQEYLAVCTWGAVNGMQLFVDNVREANNAGQTTLMRNGVDSDFVFCASHDFSLPADITVLDFRVYGKELLDAEIASIYYGQGNDNIVGDLLCRQLMNEKPDGGTATIANSVIDISGKGNHGTPVNSPTYRAAPVRLVRPPITKTIFA